MFHEVRKVDYESIDGGDKTLKRHDGKWGYFSSSCKNMPLSVWPGEGEPTEEWIVDCRDYFTTDDDESKWATFREDIRSKAVPWLASNHYDDETLVNIEWQYHEHNIPVSLVQVYEEMMFSKEFRRDEIWDLV